GVDQPESPILVVFSNEIGQFPRRGRIMSSIKQYQRGRPDRFQPSWPPGAAQTRFNSRARDVNTLATETTGCGYSRHCVLHLEPAAQSRLQARKAVAVESQIENVLAVGGGLHRSRRSDGRQLHQV